MDFLNFSVCNVHYLGVPTRLGLVIRCPSLALELLEQSAELNF